MRIVNIPLINAFLDNKCVSWVNLFFFNPVDNWFIDYDESIQLQMYGWYQT